MRTRLRCHQPWSRPIPHILSSTLNTSLNTQNITPPLRLRAKLKLHHQKPRTKPRPQPLGPNALKPRCRSNPMKPRPITCTLMMGHSWHLAITVTLLHILAFINVVHPDDSKWCQLDAGRQDHNAFFDHLFWFWKVRWTVKMVGGEEAMMVYLEKLWQCRWYIRPLNQSCCRSGHIFQWLECMHCFIYVLSWSTCLLNCFGCAQLMDQRNTGYACQVILHVYM